MPVEFKDYYRVLGATLERTVSLKVPPGTRQGHQFRIRGQRLPAGKGKRGDLYVGVSIQVPSRISKEEEDWWRKLAAGSTFVPGKTV
jgi:DnaJ-class molecular chaperone